MAKYLMPFEIMATNFNQYLFVENYFKACQCNDGTYHGVIKLTTLMFKLSWPLKIVNVL